MFHNANKVTVTGGTFTHVGAGAVKESHWKGLRLLQHKIAPGAFHNSAERYDPPKCHPHTRRAVLKKIMDWVTDVNKASPLCGYTDRQAQGSLPLLKRWRISATGRGYLQRASFSVAVQRVEILKLSL
ncbi:hypothetical protein BDZ97DRAFT_1757278 [Flammula alnicola]|nr:hypothetical protein BDZ97DRAFT_1757278 [Flammula alnicola]